MSELSVPQAPTPPTIGARARSMFGTSRRWLTQLYPNTFPWDRIGAERARARPVFGGTHYECRAIPRAWKGYGC